MDTQTDLSTDKEYQKALRKLETLKFHQKEKIGDLFPTVYCMMKSPEYKRYRHYLKLAWDWFLVPSSIWPGEFILIVRYLVRLLQNRQPLPPILILIFRFAQGLPTEQLRRYAEFRQSKMHNGEHDDLLKNEEQYHHRNAEVCTDPEVHKSWEMMKAVFNMEDFKNDKGAPLRGGRAGIPRGMGVRSGQTGNIDAHGADVAELSS